MITMYAVTLLSIIITNILGYLSFKTNVKNVNIDIKPIFNIEDIWIRNKNPIFNAGIVSEFVINLKMINLIRFIFLINRDIKIKNIKTEKIITNE